MALQGRLRGVTGYRVSVGFGARPCLLPIMVSLVVEPCPSHLHLDPDIGALIIRIGFWGPFYYIYSKESPR